MMVVSCDAEIAGDDDGLSVEIAMGTTEYKGNWMLSP
jgi:hypothetical protein